MILVGCGEPDVKKDAGDKAAKAKLEADKAKQSADKAITELLRDLFSGKHDPITVIVRKDLYELLEKAIDRCRDVGNVIANIALKNS